jgi:hypothetical protein
MIRGLDIFRQHFADFTEHYVLIGGSASELVMNEAGVDFRATKDLDIVLCIEALDKAFAETFWAFVQAGGYEVQEKSSGKKIFYRFTKPVDETYPIMLELFSRNPDNLVLGDDSQLTPIPVAEDVSSLSAILMDDNYYQFLHQHKITIDGISVVKQECIIPLKARAWLDLNKRKAKGENVDTKNIKKHKNDVFRLFQVISPELRVELSQSIADDMIRFFEGLAEEPDLPLKNFGLEGLGVIDVIDTLRNVYNLSEQRVDQE